jgi:hypothetical protein
VDNMYFMFFGAYAFNQNLSLWCVSLIASAPPVFGNTSGTNPVWGTCPD